MNRKTKTCDKCNRDIVVNNYKRHYDSCNPDRKTIEQTYEFSSIENKYYCPYCNKLFKKAGILGHIWRMHTESGNNFNPNRGYLNGERNAWNKGKTKDTDDRILKQSLNTKYKYANKILLPRVNFHWSDEQKKKRSLDRIAYLKEHPDKVPYRLNHSSKMSYPEKLFKLALEQNDICGWIYNYQNSLYTYDFAFPELKIDVEIDGSTHLSEKVIAIDTRRDIFSKSQGWKVIRFTAKSVKEDVNKCINQLKLELY